MDSPDSLNARVEYAAIGIIALMVILNFAVMIRLSIGKLILKCRQRKA